MSDLDQITKITTVELRCMKKSVARQLRYIFYYDSRDLDLRNTEYLGWISQDALEHGSQMAYLVRCNGQYAFLHFTRRMTDVAGLNELPQIFVV